MRLHIAEDVFEISGRLNVGRVQLLGFTFGSGSCDHWWQTIASNSRVGGFYLLRRSDLLGMGRRGGLRVFSRYRRRFGLEARLRGSGQGDLRFSTRYVLRGCGWEGLRFGSGCCLRFRRGGRLDLCWNCNTKLGQNLDDNVLIDTTLLKAFLQIVLCAIIGDRPKSGE